MELSELKRSREIILSVLDLKRDGLHQRCCLHGGSDCLDLQQGDDGVWLWNCHAGCGGGTVLDAAMKKYNAPDCHAAVLALERELGIPLQRDEEYREPRLDEDRAEAFVQYAHKQLDDSKALQEMYVSKKRGLSMAVVKKYEVGFLTGDGFKGKSWSIFGWSLPIRDAAGKLLGVKLHTEKPPWPQGPKCLWAPFGTYPAAKPLHGTYTLWPPPEHWDAGEKAYICAGELKALAQESAGVQATAPTSGENKLPERLVKRLKACPVAELFLNYDDDAPKKNPVTGKMVSAGNVWKDAVLQALQAAGIACLPFAHRERAAVSALPESAGVRLTDQSSAPIKSTSSPALSMDRIENLKQQIRDVYGEAIFAPGVTERDLIVVLETARPYQSDDVRTYDPRHFLV